MNLHWPTRRWARSAFRWILPQPSEEDPNFYTLNDPDAFGTEAGLRAVAVAEACISLLATQMAMLPKLVSRRVDAAWDIYEPVESHPVTALLARPNQTIDSWQFWESLMRSLYTEGDAAAWISRRTDGGAPVEMVPARIVGVRRDPKSLELRYDLMLWPGARQIAPKQLRGVPARSVLHLSYKGWHGSLSPSPIQCYAAPALKAQKGIVAAHNQHLAKGMLQALLVIADGNKHIADKQRKEAVESLRKFGGIKHAGAVNALASGMKTEKGPGLSTVDAALVELMQWTVEDVCRVFHVPPRLVGHYHAGMRTSGKPEESAADFEKYALRPEAFRLGEQLTDKLLRRTRWPGEAGRGLAVRCYTARAATGSLTETAMAVGRAAADYGLLTINEGRQRLGAPPREGANRLLTPRGGNETDAENAPADGVDGD